MTLRHEDPARSSSAAGPVMSFAGQQIDGREHTKSANNTQWLAPLQREGV